MKKISIIILSMAVLSIGLLESCDSEDQTYTVSFDANGHGTAPSPFLNVPSGSKIPKPTDPEEGYMFCGWYKESECMNIWDFEEDIVTGDMTLYAKWAETMTMTEIIATNPDIPESTDMTPPVNAWINYNDAACVAFVLNLYGGKVFC